MWSIALGSQKLWIIRPGLLDPGIVDAPSGSSVAFGSDGAIVDHFASHTFDAVVAGDPGFGGGRGRVVVYLGGLAFNPTPSLILDGESQGDLFGAAVGYLGDLNGDGFGDIAVGAPGRGSGKGRVYVFLGGASPSASPALTIDGGAAGDLFASSIARLGDINGDGYADFVVGAPGADGGRGSVSVFHGGAELPSTPSQVIAYPGPASAYGERPRFGSALAGGGDLNGDGPPDFVVGAPGVSFERGSIFVYKGGSGTIDPAGQEIPGSTAFDKFGATVVLDSLRYSSEMDLAVGSPGADEGRGVVSEFFGGVGFDSRSDGLLSGEHPDDAFGYSVGSGRLFVQAPVPQLMVGAPLNDIGVTNGGAVYYYAVPPALAVEERPVTVEADGLALRPNTYTSTQPRLVISLSGADAVDTLLSQVTIDGTPQKVAHLSSSLGTQSGAKPATSQMAAAIVIPAVSLTEGPHVLRAYLKDQAHTIGGSIEVHFLAAERLQIIAPLVYPNPAPGIARMRFTLTRAAAYELELYDVSGRRLHQLAQGQGLPEENDLHFDRTVSGPISPGVYFYVLSAQYQGQRAMTRGRVVFLR
jgi:hypothetical protein